VQKNKKEPKILLHIGLPKTGTTTLQKEFFEKLDSVRYFGSSNKKLDKKAFTVLKALLADDQLIEDAKLIIEEAKALFKNIIISDEALTLGKFMLRAKRWPVLSNPYELAKRARLILGQVEVLIVLRNQADWLLSFHRQGLKTGRYNEVDFSKWFLNERINESEMLKLLEYDHIYEAWVASLKSNHVHLRFYEDYINNFSDLALEAISIIGGDLRKTIKLADNAKSLNVTEKQFYVFPPRLKKYLENPIVNRFTPKFVIKMIKRIYAKSYSHQNINDRKEIQKMYSRSNSNLFNLLEFDSTTRKKYNITYGLNEFI
jgi:hypothetical protein